MLKLEYDKQEILEVIDRIVKRTMKMDLTWEIGRASCRERV